MADTKIGVRIALVRQRHRLTQEALGRALGVTQAAVNNWEKAKNEPSKDNLRQIAALYNEDYNWLSTGRSVDGGGGERLIPEELLPEGDAELVAAGDVPELIKPGLEPAVELWKVTGKSLEGIGVFPGDYLGVDLKLPPKAGDPVLALHRRVVGKKPMLAPVFRIYTPPALISAARTVTYEPIYLDEDDVIVRGPVLFILRMRRR